MNVQIRFIRADDEMCVCVVLSIQAKCHPQYSRRICLAERERGGNKCVILCMCVCVCLREKTMMMTFLAFASR